MPLSFRINENMRNLLIDSTNSMKLIMDLLWGGFIVFTFAYYALLWIPFLKSFSQELLLSTSSISIIPISILVEIRAFQNFFASNLIKS